MKNELIKLAIQQLESLVSTNEELSAELMAGLLKAVMSTLGLALKQESASK